MNIHLDMLDDDVYRLTFDRPDSSANVFDRDTIAELERHLDTLAGDTRMSGLLLVSAKPTIFVAGADIRELLAEDMNEQGLREMVRAGQQLFQRMAGLRVPTVAAIHGACLGGGYELCLACDYRIASDDRSTKIGLPETSLGILPAWGGCARLPRLVGLPSALDVILNGRRLAARRARKAGLVDEIVPREYFARRAQSLIRAGKPKRPSRWMVNNGLAAHFIEGRARKMVAGKTRGHYPAVARALDVVVRGVSQSLPGALALEEQAVVELVNTDVCRNLVRIFFLQERAKGLKPKHLKIAPSGGAPEVTKAEVAAARAAVIGSGVMGAGIAQWLSARGHAVVLRDINDEALRGGMATVSKVYAEGVKRHLFSSAEARQGIERISPTAAEVSLRRCRIVIEAAVERMDIKKTIFSGLSESTNEDTILATNTSALSISELAESTPSPERVIGVHFFNPVHRMQLVELVVGKQTSGDVLAWTLRFVQQIGKLPVVVKDSPGFVVNRILMPYLSEAGHLFSRGASVTAVDEAMLNYGMPMGPLRLIDEVGVDVAHHVATFFGEAFGDRMPAPDVLKAMLEREWLGRKSGAGFYTFERGSRKTPVNQRTHALVSDHSLSAMSGADLQERMVLVMLNEAARCIEEGIVSAPEDIDFAMIMGTGFAPFRGGPLRYTDSIGAEKVATGLLHLAESEDRRFEPCELLVSMARDRKKFYPN